MFNLALLFMLIIQAGTSVSVTDLVLLNVGKEGTDTAVDMYGRTWKTVDGSGQSVKVTGKSIVCEAHGRDALPEDTPFLTARISDSAFTVSIPIKTPGTKFVRLYFYANDYKFHKRRFHLRDAKFTVQTKSFPLRIDFHPGNYDIRGYKFEYSVPVFSSSLDIEFIPDSSDLNSFVFINGIEVMSDQKVYSGSKTLVGQGTTFVIDDRTALEKIDRFNVAGGIIDINDDSGLYRYWSDDHDTTGDINYLFGNPGFQVDAANFNTVINFPREYPHYVAPPRVYRTARSMGPDTGNNINFNMTWKTDVDAGNYYLLRLHFCEVLGSINEVNERVFDIFLNGELAESGVDLIAWTGKPGVPAYRDYVVLLTPKQRQIVIEMAPNLSSNSKYYDTLLSGVEVLKVINHF